MTTDTELVFYTNPMSRGTMIRWALEEIGIPYCTELLEYGASMKTPAYLAINPMGKVPAITHRGVVITESAAICAYLADAFPQANLAPAISDPNRGAYYRWLFFTAGPLEAGLQNQMLGFKVEDDKKGPVGYGEVDTMLDIIETVLTKDDYLVGNTFSMADISVSGLLGWINSTGMITPRPTFNRYLERLHSRPAAQRASEIDTALIKE